MVELSGGGRRRGSVRLPALLLGGLCLVQAGCGGHEPPRQRIDAYFGSLNAAAARGPAAQTAFLRRTQHPQFTDRFCSMRGRTFTEEPTRSTVRRDPDWAPERATSPSGTVYAVAVFLRAKRHGAVSDTQISLARVVDLDGHIYGFSPCAQP